MDDQKVIDVNYSVDVKQDMELYRPKNMHMIGAARQIDMSVMQVIATLAPSWKESQWFGVRSVEAAIVVMAKAYELGIGITSAFDFIHVISTNQGTRLVLSPKGALALIYRSGLLRQLTIDDKPGQCTVTMQRKDNGYTFSLTYTVDMAKKAGIYRKDGAWDKYESNMLRWRAIGFCSDIVFPDVKGGLHQADEYSDSITVEGEYAP